MSCFKQILVRHLIEESSLKQVIDFEQDIVIVFIITQPDY